MRIAEATTLLDYLYWARDRVLEAASALDARAFTSDATVTTRDLRSTLVHELDVEWSWRVQLQSADAEEPDEDAELEARDYPSVAALAERWRRDEVGMRAWLASLTDADLDAPPARMEDGPPLWQFIVHLVSHAIQQLSEAAVLLTRAGHSPGEIGFLEYLRATRHGHR